MQKPDVEAYGEPEGGYAKLGKFIGDLPEYAIFHSFTDLYAENLLYLQAEIVQLRKELEDIQEEDRKSPTRSKYHQDWSQLRSSRGAQPPRTAEAGGQSEASKGPGVDKGTEAGERAMAREQAEDEEQVESGERGKQYAKILELRACLNEYCKSHLYYLKALLLL